MDNHFDFNTIGRRMPYKVPDGFFEEMEQNILRQTSEVEAKKQPRRRNVLRIVFSAAVSVAAAVMFFAVFNHQSETQPAVQYSDVEQAFAQLSEEDQDYMLQVYQDDVFMEEEDL